MSSDERGGSEGSEVWSGGGDVGRPIAAGADEAAQKIPDSQLPASRPTGLTNTTTMNRNHDMRPFHDGWAI
jgi:hypothetical protein